MTASYMVPAALLVGKKGMGVVMETAVVVGYDIAIQRDEFKHTLDGLGLEPALRWEERLQLGAAATTDAGVDGRSDRLATTEFEEATHQLVATIHTDVVGGTYLSVFHVLIHFNLVRV